MLKLRYSFLFPTFSLLFGIVGCNWSNNGASSETVEPAEKLPQMKLVVIDDEVLASAIEREWSAASGQTITVKRLPAASVKERQDWTADVVIFPPSWMGELVARRVLRPLERAATSESDEEESPMLDATDFFSLTRNAEMQWGKRPYAASLGSPQFVLLYRKDVFEKLMLSAPRTWGEYAQVVKTINERADEIRPLLQIDNADRALIAEPYADGWAAKTFLARAAAYARNRSQYSCLFSIQVFEPQIDGAPFVRSLDELRAISNEVSDSFPFETPYEIAARFAAGELAMAVTWPESLRMVQQQNTSRNLNASVTSMPGANEYFDKSSAKWQPRGETESPYVPLLGITGRCVGIGRRSASVDRAYDFILWLTDPQNSARTAGLSSDTTIARNSQTSSIATLLPSTFSSLAPSLVETVQQDQSRELSLTVLRVPGHDRYLQTLSTAIRQSLKSSETSQHILQGVRAEWSKITEELGKDKQVQAYAESLGINP